MSDIVDTGRSTRTCPYCGEPQFWSTGDNAFCHVHNLNLHCDEERLAAWDLREIRKATDVGGGRGE